MVQTEIWWKKFCGYRNTCLKPKGMKEFKDAKKDKTVNEMTETYSTLISSYVKHKGLDYKKEINFREIFKHQLQVCFDILELE